MGMTEQELFEVLSTFNQFHILNHYSGLSVAEKTDFLVEIGRFDFRLVFSLYKNALGGSGSSHRIPDIRPASIIPIAETTEEKAFEEEASIKGESLLREGRVAVLIVAGGQGSRLGHDGPKGTFPISPIRKKTLFQLFCEAIRAISRRYDVRMPLLIMTSEENDRDTRTYFDACEYFGLDRENVHFFSQSMLPTLTSEGKIILRDATHIMANPDGHGGSLKAIHDSGLTDRLRNDGITELFYCQVDNPLVKIADPVFLGYHALYRAEMSTKVVRRTTIEEKVGVYASLNSKDSIIEYSDFDGRHMSLLDENGRILYWAGNTAIHILNLSFIERLNKHGFALPYHLARRSVEILGKDGKTARAEGWKFETFVFDAIGLAQKTCCMEVARIEEFSPVKNNEGADSPATAVAAMNRLFRSWLEYAGHATPPDILIEISPLFALDKREMTQRLTDRAFDLYEDTYFGG